MAFTPKIKHNRSVHPYCSIVLSAGRLGAMETRDGSEAEMKDADIGGSVATLGNAESQVLPWALCLLWACNGYQSVL